MTDTLTTLVEKWRTKDTNFASWRFAADELEAALAATPNVGPTGTTLGDALARDAGDVELPKGTNSGCAYWNPIKAGGIAEPCDCGNDCDGLAETPEDAAFNEMMRTHYRYAKDQHDGERFAKWASASIQYHNIRRAALAAAEARGYEQGRAAGITQVHDSHGGQIITPDTLVAAEARGVERERARCVGVVQRVNDDAGRQELSRRAALLRTHDLIITGPTTLTGGPHAE